jgi:hypothetical protein
MRLPPLVKQSGAGPPTIDPTSTPALPRFQTVAATDRQGTPGASRIAGAVEDGGAARSWGWHA